MTPRGDRLELFLVSVHELLGQPRAALAQLVEGAVNRGARLAQPVLQRGHRLVRLGQVHHDERGGGGDLPRSEKHALLAGDGIRERPRA